MKRKRRLSTTAISPKKILRRHDVRVSRSHSPRAAFRKAKEQGLRLIANCQRKGRFGGRGWHDFYYQDDAFAGAHASLEGYLFLKRRGLTLAGHDVDREIFEHNLCPLFDPAGVARGEPQHIEAFCTTIKVARFIECSYSFDGGKKYQQLTDQLIKKLWKCRLTTDTDAGPMWGHFLDAENLLRNPKDNARSWFASAVALEALYPAAGRHGIPTDLLRRFCTGFLKDWQINTGFAGRERDVHWMRSALPVMRTLASIKLNPADASGLPLEVSLGELLTAYLKDHIFYLGDVTVETYCYLLRSRNKGAEPERRTDYVTFEDTLMLLSAVAYAVENRRVDASFIAYPQNWLCYHRTHKRDSHGGDTQTGYAMDLLRLCGATGCNHISVSESKRRFSYIISILDCLTTVLKSNPEHEHTPMFIRPKIFKEHPYVLDPKKAFVAMPFDAPSSEAVWLVVKDVCSQFDITAIRTDRAATGENRVIMDDIWEMINESAFVIAVCTGANANVYYEIGVADTLGKTVFLCGVSSRDDFLFDLRANQRTIYDPKDTTSLRQKLEMFLRALGYKHKPVKEKPAIPSPTA